MYSRRISLPEKDPSASGGEGVELEMAVQGSSLRVWVAGDLDEATADRFRTEVEAALDRSRSRDLYLDLSAVTFIDSSGLGAIIGRYKRVRRAGGRTVLVNPGPGALKVLELAGLVKLMEVVRSDPDQAVG